MTPHHPTLWITGLPSSGKATLARAISYALTELKIANEVIDSGKFRETLLGNSLGFSKKDRDTNCKRHALAAGLLSRNGVIPIVSSISPYRSTREEIRSQLQNFIELHVSTPKATCIDWDHKGMWARALAGELRSFTGVDDPYEEPINPELTIDMSCTELHEATAIVLKALEAYSLFENSAASSS